MQLAPPPAVELVGTHTSRGCDEERLLVAETVGLYSPTIKCGRTERRLPIPGENRNKNTNNKKEYKQSENQILIRNDCIATFNENRRKLYLI